MIHALCLAASLALAQAPAPAARPQDAPSLEHIVDDRLQAAAEEPLDELWRSAAGLAGLGDQVDGPSLDALLDRRLEHPEGLSGRARLLLVAARLAGDDPDMGVLATRLGELLGEDDEELARGAAETLAEPAFRQIEGDARDAVVEALRHGIDDTRRSAGCRLACASALHAIGRGAEQREARRAMMAYLDSADVELRSQGALALAGTGEIETCRAELERLAALPGERGELAAAYLKTEDVRRFYDTRLRTAQSYYEDQLKGRKLEDFGDLERVEHVIEMIKHEALEGESHTREQLVDSAIDGMLRSLDAHSSYMPPDAYKTFDQDLLQAEYGGIGAYVNEDPDDGLFTITRPIYSGPAYRAGLQSDDKIVRIDDWPTVLPTGGSHPTDDIIKRLKGKPGTSVKLYIWRQGMSSELIDRPTEDMAVTVTREQIRIPPVHSELLPGKIGLFELTQFTRVASQVLREEIEHMQEQGMRAVVLDLRRDSGGLLEEAKDVSELFLPKGELVVTTESRRAAPEQLHTRRDPIVPKDMPVVVLIDRFSASASEIVSGALQDYGRAKLVGQRSFGKGSVQQLLPVLGEADDEYRDENRNGRYDPWETLTADHNGNGEFDFAPRVRLTIARWIRPSGKSIHRELDKDGNITSIGGVEPDYPVEPRTFERWELVEFRRINKDRTLRHWVDEHYPDNHETFLQLAAGDHKDCTLYPGFEELYQGLDTSLTRDDVRFLLRSEVRRKVQDERGAAFPNGDYEEDPQLQKAVQVALDGLGQSYTDIPDYATTFEDLDAMEHVDRPLTAGLSDARRSDLRHALTLISEARQGQQDLSAETLEELQKLIEATLENRN
jgi:carboxyl-terminal processing protease